MYTKNVENGLALMGAVLVMVAVAFAANAVFTGLPDLAFPVLDHTSTLVANS